MNKLGDPIIIAAGLLTEDDGRGNQSEWLNIFGVRHGARGLYAPLKDVPDNIPTKIHACATEPTLLKVTP